MGAAKAEIVSLAQFSVLDTTNGFTIEYTSKLLSARQKHSALHVVVARLSDELRFVYTIGPNCWVTHLRNADTVHAQLLLRLASLLQEGEYAGEDLVLMYHLAQQLEKPVGMQVCLGPLMLFNGLYHLPVFRDRKAFTMGRGYDQFNRPQLPGVLTTELKDANTPKDRARIAIGFKGNRDSAACYEASLFEQIYNSLSRKAITPANLPTQMRHDGEWVCNVAISSGWPLKIAYKSVEFYFQRVTSKTVMELVEE